MDSTFDTPRCRSDGKKGKGVRKDVGVYSARHVRLAMALQEKNRNKVDNKSATENRLK